MTSNFLSWLDGGQHGLWRLASGSIAVGAAATAAALQLVRTAVDARARTGSRSGRSDRLPPAVRPVEDTGPAWSGERLRRALHDSFGGERVIVVANREPWIHERGADGAIVARRPASGLVTALEPVVRACGGIWVGHGSGSADRDVTDQAGRVTVDADGSPYLLRRVWLDPDEQRGYYDGFSNEALWPLCHLAHARPIFRRRDWETYQAINQRFADAVVAEAGSEAPLVLVQDYHFALVPQLLRRRLPQATIVTFWHIPWPHVEQFAICPYRDAIVDGLLGSSIVGFQTEAYGRNFMSAIELAAEARVDRTDMTVVQGGRSTLVRAYPISIAWPDAQAIDGAPVEDVRRSVRDELGLGPTDRLIVCVDRLDYTKGFEERLLAIEQLLTREHVRDVAVLQIAAPSRTSLPGYCSFGRRVLAEVERINERFGDRRVKPIVMLNRHCEQQEVHRYYRAADVCYVSSLHDGMNLVAKEFVAARDDESGVLVLSQFAGSARQLTQSIIVNPYDIDGVADALDRALHMPAAEQRERMRALRAGVSRHNLYRWAGTMLSDAAAVRAAPAAVDARAMPAAS